MPKEYKLGLRTPEDCGHVIDSEYSDETGMHRDVHTSMDDFGQIIGYWHDDVGLVTYYREV